MERGRWVLKSASVGGLGSCIGGIKKAEDWEKSSESDESVERLMSLSRWLPPLHSSTLSSSPPPTSPCSTAVTTVESGGLQEFWEQGVAFCRDSLALIRAFSMVSSSRARWHWASSRLDVGEALVRRGDEDRDGRERGSDGRGMDIGELMLSLLGGEDEGLILSEEPRRERRLLPRSLSSTFSLIQEIFSGMLRCRTGGAVCCAVKRGGGGRGGGNRVTLSGPLSLWLVLVCSSVFLSGFCRFSCCDWLLWLWSELQTWASLLLPFLLSASSLRSCFPVSGMLGVKLWLSSGWWTFRKRGLMKHSAPLAWQHSSSDGVRVWSRGRPEVAVEDTGLWAGGGGLSGAAVPVNDTGLFLLLHNGTSQKPKKKQQMKDLVFILFSIVFLTVTMKCLN